MKRWSATLLAFAVCSAVVHADVTLVQKMTMEGGMMAAAAASGATVPSPVTTTRIKGLKGRTDMDLNNPAMPANISTITDVAAKQVTILDHNQKTARVSTPGAAPATPPAGSPPAPPATMKVDGSATPTGKSQMIDGTKCDEFAFTTSISMGEMGGQMPPEAAEAMKGITMVMKGSLWVAKAAPGAEEYLAYQKAMSSAELMAAALGASGLNMPGMDKLTKAMQGVSGVPMLTEMDMTVEGTGPMADMMRQMGAMHLTTKVTSIKTDAIADDVFQVPAGYQIIK